MTSADIDPASIKAATRSVWFVYSTLTQKLQTYRPNKLFLSNAIVDFLIQKEDSIQAIQDK